MYKSTLFSVIQVYKGYVDDPRNTDNAWMETVAVNFHDETGTAARMDMCLIQLFVEDTTNTPSSATDEL